MLPCKQKTYFFWCLRANWTKKVCRILAEHLRNCLGHEQNFSVFRTCLSNLTFNHKKKKKNSTQCCHPHRWNMTESSCPLCFQFRFLLRAGYCRVFSHGHHTKIIIIWKLNHTVSCKLRYLKKLREEWVRIFSSLREKSLLAGNSGWMST